jgi:hypothetical protein
MKGLDLVIPKYLRDYIDQSRNTLSRARYILDCILFIKNNNIDIYYQHEPNEGEKNDRIENSPSRGKNVNRGSS